MKNTAEKLKIIRLNIIDSTLFSILFLAPIGALSVSIKSINTGWLDTYSVSIFAGLIGMIVAAFRDKISFNYKFNIFIALLIIIGASSIFQNGLLSFGFLYLLTAIGMTAILQSSHKSIFYCILACFLVIIGAGTYSVTKNYAPNYDALNYMTSTAGWASAIINIMLLSSLFAYTLVKYNSSLINIIDDSVRSAALAKKTQKVALMAMANLAEFRDNETGAHVIRVARMSHEIARTLLKQGIVATGYENNFLEHIGIASTLHDVGKVGIPDSILLKPGKLTPKERVIIEYHPVYGGTILEKAAKMLSNTAQFKIASEVAKSHHEHWDGNGYPNKLTGNEIPLSARIVAIADVFDALTAIRPYKQPWPLEKALSFIRERSGTQFDPAVVDAFFDVLSVRNNAPVIEWSDDIATGELIIDEDHKVLLALINQMTNPENLKDLTSIKFVLDELISYSHYHFNREEYLMAASNYPHLKQHKKSHAYFVAQLENLHHEFDEGKENISTELSDFLGKWFVQHIMKMDKDYCKFMAKS